MQFIPYSGAYDSILPKLDKSLQTFLGFMCYFSIFSEFLWRIVHFGFNVVAISIIS